MSRKAFFITLLTTWVIFGTGKSFAEENTPCVNFHHLVNSDLVLNARGAAAAYLCEIPPTELGTTTTLCFDIPLFNLKTGAYVGTLTSSMADVVQIDPNEPSRLFATITSQFRFTEWPQQPELVVRGPGSVQPFTGGSPTMTHMTGSIPSPGDNNVLSGTDKFSFASGSARESGAVNLANFRGQAGDEIIFDLLWVIDLN